MATSVEFGELPQNAKPVVVGVDFGTAFSGVAWSFKADPERIVGGAPTAPDATVMKVPTSLLQLPNDRWLFGFEAENEYFNMLASCAHDAVPECHLYRRFKMALKGATTGFDSLEACAVDGHMYNLMELITKSLEVLKLYALERVSVWGYLNLSDIHWVLTVPCMWNDFGKSFMRKAAVRAGMIEYEQADNLTIKLEPEAASLSVHKYARPFDILSIGKRFMVLDAGGGTVDITAHEVESVDPIALRNIATPCGKDCGAENVDNNFKNFLMELLENNNISSNEHAFEVYSIMQDFNLVKRMFDGRSDPQSIRLVDVLENKKQLVSLAEAHNARHPHIPIILRPNLRNGYLSMSKELMLSFFEPTLQQIVTEVRSVLRETPGLQYIIMVGGYSANNVLLDRIRNEFDWKRGVRVVFPDPNPRPQAAIMQGAVLFGMFARVLQPLIANHSFGLMVSTNVHSIVQRGQSLELNQSFTIRAVTENASDEDVLVEIVRDGTDVILQLVAPCPPNATGAREVTITVQFKTLQVVVSVRNGAGEEFQQSVIVKDLRQGRVPGALRVVTAP